MNRSIPNVYRSHGMLGSKGNKFLRRVEAYCCCTDEFLTIRCQEDCGLSDKYRVSFYDSV